MQVPVVAVVRPALGMWNVPGSNCSRLRWPTGDASTVPIRSRAPHSPPSPGTRRPIGGWVPDPAAYYCFPVDSASRASAWAARKNLLRPRSPMVSTLNACCNAAASASETPARALTGGLEDLLLEPSQPRGRRSACLCPRRRGTPTNQAPDQEADQEAGRRGRTVASSAGEPQPVRQLLRRAMLVGADRRLQRRVGVLKDQPAARSQRGHHGGERR